MEQYENVKLERLSIIVVSSGSGEESMVQPRSSGKYHVNLRSTLFEPHEIKPRIPRVARDTVEFDIECEAYPDLAAQGNTTNQFLMERAAKNQRRQACLPNPPKKMPWYWAREMLSDP